MRLITILAVMAAAFYAPVTFSRSIVTYGDWSVIRSDDGKDLIAGTANPAGNFVAFRCFSSTKQCVHALVADIVCDDGDKYPILVNSETSSLSMEAVCSKNGETHELFLTKYDEIHEVLLKGKNVGFAIPMNGGNFKAVRFSLDGSEKAINFVKEVTSNLDNGETYF